MTRTSRTAADLQHARHVAAMWLALTEAQVLAWLAAQDETPACRCRAVGPNR